MSVPVCWPVQPAFAYWSQQLSDWFTRHFFDTIGCGKKATNGEVAGRQISTVLIHSAVREGGFPG
jgi:hypothetical protein